jgi:hypothetical protein
MLNKKGQESEARLHLQFLLRFLVRFSPFDRCERASGLITNVLSTQLLNWTFVAGLLVHI